MPIYMDYPEIKGDVTAEGFKEKIEVSSFQFGVGRGISAPTGGVADREASAPSVSEITITKMEDASSIKLFEAALVGEGKTVKLTFVKTDKGKLENYLEFELTDTMISGYSLSSGGDRPSESISLSFTKVKMSVTTMKPDGTTGDPSHLTYDIGAAKVA